jgi:hypothetical protein
MIALATQAEVVVTACGTDDAAGGTNLKAALAIGGDIRIACAGGANAIKLTTAHSLASATTIDAGNATLIGPGSGVMFMLSGAQPLKLLNASIQNPPANPVDPDVFTGIVYDTTDTAVVELDTVRVSQTRLPFAVRRLVARNSSFDANGDANNADFGVVMAGELELESVVFRDNLSRPFHALWRGDPVAKKQKISARIRQSTFERNKRPGVWAAGDLLIDTSHFIDNGDAVPFAPGGKGSLYGGQVFLELASSAAGAVEVVLGQATISRSTFRGNRGMLGGAVLAWRAGLTLQSSTFDGNHAVSAGAVAYLSPAGSHPLMSRLRFSLAHVKLRGNDAVKDAGALLVLGEVSGDAVLMSGNRAGESGGALAVVSPSVSPAESVPAAVAEQLPEPGTQTTTVSLSRTFVLDNTAALHAVDAANGRLRLGNTLLARNSASASGGAALLAQNLELTNSTVIANQSDGVSVRSGGAQGVRLANTIVAGHGVNCSGAVGALKSEGANLQYPGNGCGAAITVAEPSLDARFEPTLGSSARSTGSAATCATHDLVAGRDLYGDSRGAATCSIGAVEADVVRNVINAIGEENVRCFLWLLVIFVLVCAIVGFVVGALYRRRKKV